MSSDREPSERILHAKNDHVKEQHALNARLHGQRHREGPLLDG